MKRHFEAFRSALALLTILPGGRYIFDKSLSGLSSAYYSAVGAVLAIILILLHSSLLSLFTPIHTNVVLFVLLIVLYGGLHFDGLSDTVDGLFVPKERALEVMKDPHAGTMGILFGFLTLLLSLSAFIQIDDMLKLLPVLMASRFFATFILYKFDYISQNGIATQIKSEITFSHILFSFLAVVVIALSVDLFLLFVLLLGAICAYSTALFFKMRYSGVNGDILGAIILLSELVMFNALLF